MALKVFELDPKLKSVGELIWERVKGFRWWKEELEKLEGGLSKFADGYRLFGFTRQEGSLTFREWVPDAKQVFLIGEFNKWENTTPLTSEGFGRWSVVLKDSDGQPAIAHKCQVKLRIQTNGNQWIERVPAWTRLAWQDPNTNLFNGVMWQPAAAERYVFKHDRPPKPVSPKIYEAHVGMSSKDPKVATYLDFAEHVLPRIKRLGYNTVQLMAVAEHAFYGSFGYHVTSYFAPSSRCGTPEELKKLVDEAHALGLVVIMDLVHAHCSSNAMDGIAAMDGTDHCYTHGGRKGHHVQWDSKLFHYMKHEVLRFLLSNIKYWLEEFRFDGYRFDGVTSMLYHSHGIGKGFSGNFHDYFGGDADLEGQIYVMLANQLVHEVHPNAITVAEDVSGMPTLCLPIEDGGFGFDYRLAMAVPDMWIKLLKEVPDDLWDVGFIRHTLTNRRWKEKCIAYAESHDQSIVGDKTIAFWLMDQEMYYGMSMACSPQPSIPIDRGLALHKVIRLLVLGLGGQGYLNFMGNEFGHPEWVDFPRAENAWSHHFCRRRWDLADDEALRYKYFQNFDELMQALENRFKWLSSEHEFVTICNLMDKVLAFERGELIFVVNLDPNRSFEGYQVGIGKEQEMRIVLDSDEERFGGHCRLEEGHGKLPMGGPTHNRPSSCYLYLPCRTAQVLAPAELLEGGIRVWLDSKLLKEHKIFDPSDVNLAMEISDGGKKYLRQFRFDQDACVRLPCFDASFALFGPEGTLCSCRCSPDGMFKVFFPGDYTVQLAGYLEAEAPARPFRAVKLSRSRSEVLRLEAEQAELLEDPSLEAGSLYPEAMVLGPSTSQLLSPSTPKSAPTPKSLPSLPRTPRGSATPKSLASPKSFEMPPSVKDEKFDFEERRAARMKSYKERDASLDDGSSAKDLGLHYCRRGWIFKDWIPGALYVSLIGDFNGWDSTATPLRKGDDDVWCCFIGAPLNAAMTRGGHYRLHVVPSTGSALELMPSWAQRYVLKAPKVNGVVCTRAPKASRKVELKGLKLHLLEFDVTLILPIDGKPELKHCREVLRHAAKAGYHGVVLVGLFGSGNARSLGSSLLAASPCLPDAHDFQAFLEHAHQLGLALLLELPMGAKSSYLPQHFFDQAGLFDFSRKEVSRYLLYALQHWLDLGVDGLRLTLPTTATVGCSDLFAQRAAGLLHRHGALAVAVGQPLDGLCDSPEAGGYGFGLCQPTEGPDYGRLLPGGSEAKLEGLVDALMEPLQHTRLLTYMESMQEFIVSQSPLLVCMISWETLYTVSGGPAAPYVTGLAEALVTRGHEVHVFTRASHGLRINVEHINSVTYNEVPYTLSTDFVEETKNFCEALAKAICEREEAYGQFDIAHGHEWLVSRVRSGLRKELHYVLTVHSTEELRSGGAEFGGQSGEVIELEREAFGTAQELFASSQTVRESMQRQYGLGKEVKVVHHGALALKEATELEQKEAREDLKLPLSAPVLLYMNRLLHEKGADLLVEAIPFVLQHWKDAFFVICGTGHLRGSLERRCAELHVAHAVVFKGQVEPEQYLEACDAVVIPARQELYGVQVIESWAAARPVVSSACGELRHLIKPDVTGYTVDQESGNLAWGICKICENRQHARWMGQQGWKQVQQSFLWDIMAWRTEEVYIELLGLREAPRGRVRRRPLAAALGGTPQLYRLCRLLAIGFGGEATLSCLGSDFGWQGKVDFPRKGNDFSEKQARIPTELACDKGGKQKLVAFFQMCLLRTERCLQWLSGRPKIYVQDEQKQLLILTRAACIFALNFGRGRARISFAIPQLKGVACHFKTVLNTQDPRFGGTGKPDQAPIRVEDGEMELLIPAHTGLVLASSEVEAALLKDKVLQLASADDFIDIEEPFGPVAAYTPPTFEQIAVAAKEAAAREAANVGAASEAREAHERDKNDVCELAAGTVEASAKDADVKDGSKEN